MPVNELGASSLSKQAKAGLKARIEWLANTITLLGELVQTVLGNKFSDWRAEQNKGESAFAMGEAKLKGSASCQRGPSNFWIGGGSKWTFKGREYNRCIDPGACNNPFEMDANLFNGGYFHL